MVMPAFVADSHELWKVVVEYHRLQLKNCSEPERIEHEEKLRLAEEVYQKIADYRTAAEL